MKHKAGKLKRIVMTFVTLLFIAFILSNSIRTGEASSAQSAGALRIMQSAFDFLNIAVTVTSHFIRKLAHFIEFCILGILMGFTLRTYTRKIFKNVFTPLFCGLAVAVTDEFIQLYSAGRAGAVRDVVLDFSGFVFGIAAALLIISIRKKRNN